MPSKSRTQAQVLPHAGLISGVGTIALVLGIIWLFLNFLNPLNIVIGIIGVFWGPAGIQFLLNVFMGPVILMAFGVVMLMLGTVRR